MRVRASVHKIDTSPFVERRKGRLYVRANPSALVGEPLQTDAPQASLNDRIVGTAGRVAELAMAADLEPDRRDRIIDMAAGVIVRHEFAQHMPAQGQLPQERTQ